MSEIVERAFPAKALMFGIRSIGYSFPMAVADILDNSISANAKRIDIYSEPENDAYFCILDNGRGMNEDELDNAMLPGSDREHVADSDKELGRFGLGLKSASLSQCRRFTVVSKQADEVHAMAFDLDLIEEMDRLMLYVLNEEEIAQVPMVDELRKYKTGTLVVWTKFDKIENLAKDFEDSFRILVAESKKHVELVFHRFYKEIEIYFNEKRIEERDPFLLNSLGRQQTGRVKEIAVGKNKIVITPYTLPYANTLTAEEKALLGNPKSIYDEQGFYLYRNKRLISWGSWMHMGVRSELSKLARIQVDIPSSLDSIWMLDVKKSTAKIPDKLKDQIRASVSDSVQRSKKTTKRTSFKAITAKKTVWERLYNAHEGKVRYQINRELPELELLYSRIGDDNKGLLDVVLNELESCLPQYSIINDSYDSLNITNASEDTEEEKLISELKTVISLAPDRAKQKKMFDQLLATENYISLIEKKDQVYRSVFGDDGK